MANVDQESTILLSARDEATATIVKASKDQSVAFNDVASAASGLSGELDVQGSASTRLQSIIQQERQEHRMRAMAIREGASAVGQLSDVMVGPSGLTKGIESATGSFFQMQFALKATSAVGGSLGNVIAGMATPLALVAVTAIAVANEFDRMKKETEATEKAIHDLEDRLGMLSNDAKMKAAAQNFDDSWKKASEGVEWSFSNVVDAALIFAKSLGSTQAVIDHFAQQSASAIHLAGLGMVETNEEVRKSNEKAEADAKKHADALAKIAKEARDEHDALMKAQAENEAQNAIIVWTNADNEIGRRHHELVMNHEVEQIASDQKIAKASLTDFNSLEKELIAMSDQVGHITGGVISTFSQGLTRAFMDGVTGSQTFGDALVQMAERVIEKLVEMVIEAAIFDALMGILTGGVGGALGAVPGLATPNAPSISMPGFLSPHSTSPGVTSPSPSSGALVQNFHFYGDTIDPNTIVQKVRQAGRQTGQSVTQLLTDKTSKATYIQ